MIGLQSTMTPTTTINRLAEGPLSKKQSLTYSNNWRKESEPGAPGECQFDSFSLLNDFKQCFVLYVAALQRATRSAVA
jgi:hypothetical protein